MLIFLAPLVKRLSSFLFNTHAIRVQLQREWEPSELKTLLAFSPCVLSHDVIQ